MARGHKDLRKEEQKEPLDTTGPQPPTLKTTSFFPRGRREGGGDEYLYLSMGGAGRNGRNRRGRFLPEGVGVMWKNFPTAPSEQRLFDPCPRLPPSPSVSSPRPDPEGGAVTTEREWGGAEIYMKTTGNNG